MLRPLSEYEKTYSIEKIIGRGQYGIFFILKLRNHIFSLT